MLLLHLVITMVGSCVYDCTVQLNVCPSVILFFHFIYIFIYLLMTLYQAQINHLQNKVIFLKLYPIYEYVKYDMI